MFLKYLHFFPDHSGYVENRLDKKGKVNFKIYDVINWETNTLNIHISQYLTKYRQSDNEISMKKIKFYTVCFYCMTKSRIKVLTICIYLKQGSLKKPRWPGTSLTTSLKKKRKITLYSIFSFNCLIDLTSWAIGKYVYCNCLVSGFWLHKSWN